MDKQELISLREIFRKRFQEVDFCIGEEQVEVLFRELLDEPEFECEIKTTSSINLEKIEKILPKIFTIDNIKSIFEKDDNFYSEINKGK